ncbi:hypothetical protein PF004_g1705 [Phytophthora fragariae]|uniref:Bromo domain-containing protein n=1 Tax=Phytophthora fragariae TaxID=53985 RepID=A0A6G0PRL2_9STRA|nr:hypothetical protein PF004_g1705 [Phytophthora fragariae]
MSSSSSSGYSDEDTEASAPSAAAPPSASELGHVVELAQICSFCSTFRQPLRLPSFTRTELQEAILGASSGDTTHLELLAELHFKLAREHPTAKMEKMVQDWEKTLARKLQENWGKEFTANPMAGGVTYRELTVFQRVKILDALCHWKLDTCAEIHKHIATLQKENDNEAIKRLRAGEIGTDDNGVSYWYFDDGCWIYAENKPRWQRQERKPSYLVEFASAKRIRLSINFDPDHNSSAPPLRLPLKSVAFVDEIKEHKAKDEVKMPDENATSEALKVEAITVEMVKQEPKAETSSTTTVDETITSMDKPPMNVKEEQPPHASNGSVEKQEDGSCFKPPASQDKSPQSSTQEGDPASSSQDNNVNNSGKTPQTDVSEDNSGGHVQPCVVAVVGSKKRAIIDDDSSESNGVDTAGKTSSKQGEHPASPPPRKKRKASVENCNIEATVEAGKYSGDSTKPGSPKVNESAVPEASKAEPVASDRKEAESLAPKSQTSEIDVRDVNSSEATLSAAGKETSTSLKEENEATPKGDNDGIGSVSKTDGVTDAAKTSGPASTSPTDPAAAYETFDITCESCKKCYDMRYVDPPLVERPSDEWRCFECLVNDARGWPRRRKTTRKEPFSPRADDRGAGSSSKKRSSSSKARSSSSSSKKSKKSSSKSSSSKKKSSHSSSSSKRKSSSSKSSSSKKSSSSSSSKRHKKRKSSSSSSHHHSSSHGHHRRRHHSHHHQEEFVKLVSLFRERQEQRLGIEEARIKGDLLTAFDETPQGWRVVSSTLDDLRGLIQSLSGGSLEQDRLRGRLILIMKDQEKLDEQRRKQQELAWNILPRRQSSRIAIGRMKNQSVQDSDAEDGYSEDDVENRRPGLRSRRSHSDGVDGQQKNDRAWRAQRRHQVSDDDMDLDDDDDDLEGSGVPGPGNWINWPLVKGNARCLSTVCLAFVNRLLKEEASDLFSRPVDPELDGCPNYLSVIDHPMDLGTIRSRVEASFYRKWELFKKDVELVWQNCRTFNAPDTMVVQFADLLSKLSRSMCNAAEKNGVIRMKDKGSGGDESEGSLSDASKAESHSSVNKAWTESSASESSDSSNGGPSSDGDSDSDGTRKRRSARTSSKKPRTRSGSTKSRRTSSSPANKRASRSTRSRSSKKRPAPTSSSEDESSASEDEVVSPVRKSRRPLRGSGKPERKVDPPTEEEDSSADDSANNIPPPPHNGAPSPSPPPPPPPSQSVQNRPKPRLIISDSSSSDDSSGSDGNSSSSSSSDSDGSDSDSRPSSKKPQPPPPSSAVPAPPPPTPPPPAASPDDSKPHVRPSPSNKTRPKAAAEKKVKLASAGKTTSGYTHSPPLLNSYLSPSSSSSSDLSSDDSESSDSDSD